ncbi:MAG: MFS transporter, partial [Abditibacteriaceae bacterium]
NSIGSYKSLLFERNRAVIVWFEFLFGLALPFVAVMTLLPGYFDYLGVSKVWIGALPALQCGVTVLVQPWSIYRIRPGKRRLRNMRLAYTSCGLSYVVLGILVMRGGMPPALAVFATLLAVMIFSVAAAVADPHYYVYVVESVDALIRGRYFGLRLAFSSTGGMIGGLLAALILRDLHAPMNFGLCILLGGILLAASTLIWNFYRKSEETTPPRNTTGFRHFIGRRIWTFLQERDFRVFAVSVILFGLSTLAYPFLALLIKAKLGASDQVFGLLAGVAMAGCLFTSCLLGVVCDRWNARWSVALSLVLYMLGVLGCLLLHDRVGLFLSYALTAVWIPSQAIGISDMALRLAPDATPSEIFTIKTLVLAPPQVLGPMLAGAAIDRWSFEPLLYFCLLCAVVSLLVLSRCRYTLYLKKPACGVT